MAKILVTEDSPTILGMIKESLEAEGYEVVTAVDGQEALDKARKEAPDLSYWTSCSPK